MCDPCRVLRRCNSCHGGCYCCPRPNCSPRSCSIDSRSCRVVFPGEFQKFSDMVAPSFLQKQPKPLRKKKRSKSCTACGDRCKDQCADKFTTKCVNPSRMVEKEKDVDEQQNDEVFRQDGETGFGAFGPGFNEAPGAGFVFQPGQPTIIPCYGTYGPSGNPLIFGIPPPTQYGNFGIPGPVVLPVAQPSVAGQGDFRNPGGPPAAGLPTKYVSGFNPCTGEIIQCENQPNSAGQPIEMRQGPSYNQFCQGLGVGFGPNSQVYPFNVAQQPIAPMHDFQSNPHASQVPRGGNRSKSVGPPTQRQPMNYAPNNQNYPYNVGVLSPDSRQVPQPMSPAVQERQDVTRSKSPRQRNESRGGRLDKPSEFRRAAVFNELEIEHNNCHFSNNVGDRNPDPKTLPKSKPSAGRGDSRCPDSRKPNHSMGAPLNNSKRPESNVPYIQQSVGMGIDPSNQYFPYNVADCPLNDTFVLDSTYGQTRHNNNERSHSARARKESKERSEKSKKSTAGSPTDPPVKCYCTRFDPNNQYYPYYVSEEGKCLPPGKMKDSKECSEHLNRVTDSCPPCDLQKWCHLLMPKGKHKKQGKPVAKNSKKTHGSFNLGAKSKMSLQSSKAQNSNEVVDSETPQTTTSVETAASVEIETPQAEDPGCPCGCKGQCPAPSPKPEMRSCSCSANLPEVNGATAAPFCPANSANTACWNSCPCTWYYSPCNGYYYYCANCCNGCHNCCNHCCSPCVRCCSGSCPSQLEKVPPKPKQKEKEKPDKLNGSSSRRSPAGTAVDFNNLLNNPGSCRLPPPPGIYNCSMPAVSTMPGYGPTAQTQFNSPYSGHWEAGGVDINRTNQHYNRSPLNISCMRHG
ncbi:uncharacterized protein LOC128257939 isoform X2 [Drosophila gunungcola]|uniref:uncharacterized protein LOC128257939 isoform X2 n=1 Tax=Drosophila gunungcola TaxID=103775 RepID=UPI0022E3F6D1|nr:uncharacterized protein LOC128257939 isoform X2 [Drosophila gunungcola]